MRVSRPALPEHPSVDRRLGRMTRCIGIATVAIVLWPSVAGASGGGMGCNPNRTPNFNVNSSGEYENLYYGGIEAGCSGNSCGGVQGYIYTYSPYVDPVTSNGYNNADAGWVMLTDFVSRFSQIGWLEQENNVRSVFVEYYDPAYGYNWINTDYVYPGFKELEEYKIDYNPACTDNECWTWWDAPAGSTNWTYLTSSRDSHFVPSGMEADVEAKDQASQFPGGSGDPEYTDALQVYAPAGTSGSWAPTTGSSNAVWESNYGATTNPLPSFDKEGSVTGSSYETWDSACTN